MVHVLVKEISETNVYIFMRFEMRYEVYTLSLSLNENDLYECFIFKRF